MKYTIAIFIIILFISQAAQACTLTKGYRSTARLPNIQANNDSGLYYDLYHKAAFNIGCQLNIIRSSKKRIMRQIKNGTIDFYPGLTFTPARAEFVLFIPNGLPSLDIGLTRIDVEEIKGPEDFAGKILLSTFGSTELIRHQHALVVKRPSELSHSIAINHILAGRADVYVDELSTIAYLLKDNLRKKELKYHLNCCGGLTDLTMGFSRKSIHYSEVENTLYNPEKPLSFDNYPMMLGSNSIAYRFYQSLLLLKANSYTDKLYLQYFGFDVHSIQTYNEDTEEKIKD